MPQFGDFQPEKILKRGRHATLHSATSLSQPSRQKLAIKIWRIPDATLTPEALESAHLQQAAADKGGKHLAPIFDHGFTEDEGLPWYVTRLYEISVEKLLRYNTADPTLLYRIVSDVLQGLKELWQAAHRPHGNLKPSNILLDDTDPRKLHAVLSDPAAIPKDRTPASDLFELGQIIYQIVYQKPDKPDLHPPLTWTPEWEPFGARWFDFTNLLLKRDSNQEREVIGLLQKRLKDLPVKKGRMLFVTIALLMAGGGSTAAWLYFANYRKPTDPQANFTAADRQHAIAIRDLCLHPPPALTKLSSFQLDQYLQTNFEKLAELRPDKLCDAFRAATSVEQWPAKKTVKQAAETYQERGWHGLSDALQSPSSEVNLDGNLTSQLIATLEAREWVDRINSEWGPLDVLFREWGDDKALAPLKEWQEAKMRSYTDVADSAQDIARDRENLRDKARTGALRLNHRRFVKALASAKIASPQDWLEQAQQYQSLIDARALNPLHDRLDAVLRQLPPNLQTQAKPDVDLVNDCLEDPVEQDIHENGAVAIAIARLEKLINKPAPTSATAASTTASTSKPNDTTLASPATPPPVATPESQPAAPDYSQLKQWLESLRQAQSVDSLQKLLENATVPPQQQSFVDSIRRSLGPTLDAQTAVPKLSEPWKLIATSNVDPEKHSVAYEYAYGRYRMTFVRIPSQRSYMAAAELPLGLAVDSQRMPEKNSVTDGPQVWTVPPGKNVQPAAAWRWKKGAMDIISKAVPNATFYATSAEPEPPSLLTPLNAISVDEAQKIAGALQCRLPTYAEWNTAFNSLRSTGERPQLRGGKWLDQFNHWVDYGTRYRAMTSTQFGGNTPWPDDRSYLRGTWPASAPPQTSPEAENRALWFRNVHEASPTVEVHDMVGNVAEFLADGESYSVIGGSALSNPEEALKQTPVHIKQAFSDAGIRLVVDAGPNNDLTEVHKWLDTVAANLNAQPGGAH